MAFISSFASIRNQCLSKEGKISVDGSGGSMDDFLLLAYASLKAEYPKYYKMDQLSKLGFLASELVVGDRSLKREYPPDDVAVVLSNASSSLDTDRKYFESTRQLASPSLFVYTLPNIVAGEICIRQGLKGESVFFIAPRFDPQFIYGYVREVFSRGAQACIAGWVETNGKTHDVFLYLTEIENKGLGIPHTADMVSKLYNT